MKKQLTQKLIFIYNANSNLQDRLLDSAHKIISPSTYKCSLCHLTFNAFAEKSIWKKFRKENSMPMQFLHKDEFTKIYKSKFGHKFTFPIILIENQKTLEIFIKKNELNKINTAKELITMIKDRIYLF